MKGMRLVRGVWLSAMLVPAAISATPAPADAQGPRLIRDAEVEALLNEYAQPIFRAAGFPIGRVTVRIVNDESFNAFVIDSGNVYINTGTLLQALTPNEVIGIIAHESGHIEGAHTADRRLLIKQLTLPCFISPIGCLRKVMAVSRIQEQQADRAGVKYLEATKQSGKGMLDTFERLAQQEAGIPQDSYLRSHPAPAQRIALLRSLVEHSPYYAQKDSPALQLRHDLMRAKLTGYCQPKRAAFGRYPVSDTSLPARYARAIAQNCSSDCRGNCSGATPATLASVDDLLKASPSTSYFWELKGNILVSSGHYAEAVAPLRKAVQLAGDNAALMKISLAEALVKSKDAKGQEEALTLLRKVVVQESDNAQAYNLLGEAYYNKGLFPQADLARAQGLFYWGDVKQAQTFAKRAQSALKPGTPDWTQADDIINFKPPT